MPKQRYEVDGKGRLIDQDGTVLGRLVAVEFDLSDELVRCRAGGGSKAISSVPAPELSSSRQESLLPPPSTDSSTTTSASSNGDVATVWAHYQRCVPGGNRYTLDPKRERIIRNALAVRPLATVLDAITGLSKSPHHLGQNDRRKKYLGIQYALAGMGNESNDERIDKMAAKANVTVADFIANLPSAGREMVKDHMNKVAAYLLHPDDANLRARAEGSATYLLSTFGLTPHVQGHRVEWSISATGE